MLLSESVKPISYIKAHAAEVLDNVAKTRNPVIITQNGHAKAIIQDLRSYEEVQETLAMLKVVAAGEKAVDEGRVKPIDEAFAEIRRRVRR
ncbi:MAG: type II toxin-antitoxin system Phd/YefM family antitoxin [Verrucomicrobia bacterium]|nr:type II toxin-antitoxin system Phd/YefM family antitoxin [Verrucomicrobiota bacterium]